MNANPQMLGATSAPDAATKEVETIWAEVFATSNKVIAQSGVYGFHCIELIPNPNIHQMLHTMKVVAGMLDEIIGSLDQLAGNPGNIRMVLNAREQITKLEAVAAALIIGDEKLYGEAIQKLKNQAVF